MSISERIAHRLGQLGYALAQGLTAAVRDAQKVAGLDPTGELDTATVRAIEAPRFCGLPDVMPLVESASTPPRWPNPKIYWGLANKWPGNTEAAIASIDWACKRWEEACDVEFIYCETSFPADAQSIMLIRSAPMDGPGGVLAESELANNRNGTKHQKYDSRESAWVDSDSPRQFEIDLNRVACHEIGHFLGIPHIRSGNLLQPTYDLRIRVPQAGDIQEAQARYGPPRRKPAPPVDPPPSPAGGLTIQIQGAIGGILIPGYRIQKLETGV